MNEKVLQQKQTIVQEVVEAVKAVDAVIVTEYRGLTVEQLTDLRRELKEVDAKLVVYKNSLVSRALTETGHGEQLDEYLKGPNDDVFSKDVIAGPNVLRKFARKNEELIIKGGLIEGRVVDGEQVKEIGKLPGRNGLLSMFLSVLNAPIQKFAATVKAVAEHKEASAS